MSSVLPPIYCLVVFENLTSHSVALCFRVSRNWQQQVTLRTGESFLPIQVFEGATLQWRAGRLATDLAWVSDTSREPGESATSAMIEWRGSIRCHRQSTGRSTRITFG